MKKSSEVLLPGTVWAKWDWDWDWSNSKSRKVIRYTITILAEVPSDAYSVFRVRAIEIHTNGVTNHLTWSPPGDESGLRTMGYRRVL